MPLVGTRDLTPILDRAPLMPSLDTEQWALPGARILQVLYEIDDSAMLSLLPRALHPTIPPTVFFVVTHVPESSVGPFTLAEVRVGCRSAMRPRTFLTRAYCDNAAAVTELRNRWGYPVEQAEATLQRYYDRAHGLVTAGGRDLLDVSLVNPEPISGSDVQYLPNVNLARIQRDGAVVPRLIQVDPDFTFRSADRGKPMLTSFVADAWELPGCEPNYPVSASYTVADVTMPKLRFIVDPNKGPMEGVEHV